MDKPDVLECPICGAQMTLKYSKRGTFLGCSRYPACKAMRRISSQEEKEIAGLPRLPTQDPKNGNGKHEPTQ
jgi:ssDNA-binding Zn-finger/Zn-ribbon topoisomerase 1